MESKPKIREAKTGNAQVILCHTCNWHPDHCGVKRKSSKVIKCDKYMQDLSGCSS